MRERWLLVGPRHGGVVARGPERRRGRAGYPLGSRTRSSKRTQCWRSGGTPAEEARRCSAGSPARSARPARGARTGARGGRRSGRAWPPRRSGSCRRDGGSDGCRTAPRSPPRPAPAPRVERIGGGLVDQHPLAEPLLQPAVEGDASSRPSRSQPSRISLGLLGAAAAALHHRPDRPLQPEAVAAGEGRAALGQGVERRAAPARAARRGADGRPASPAAASSPSAAATSTKTAGGFPRARSLRAPSGGGSRRSAIRPRKRATSASSTRRSDGLAARRIAPAIARSPHRSASASAPQSRATASGCSRDQVGGELRRPWARRRSPPRGRSRRAPAGAG